MVAWKAGMSKERFIPEDLEKGQAYFKREEAEAIVGRWVKTRVAWAGVPEGTTGQVVAADNMGRVLSHSRESIEIYDAVIEWDLPVEPARASVGEIAGEVFILLQPGGPLRDWFTKQEYERYLEEIVPGEGQENRVEGSTEGEGQASD